MDRCVLPDVVVTLLLLSLAVFLAALVRGATGFGFALIAAPILSLVWPTATATSIVLLLDLVATALLMRGGALAGLDRREATITGAAALVGALAGVLLLKVLPEEPALLGLNLAVLVSALAALMRVRSRHLEGETAAAAAGFLTGAMIGAFSVGGTLVVAWLILAGRSPARSRALLTVVFALTDAGSLLLRVGLGVLPAEALGPAVALLPALALGLLAGHVGFRRLDAESWKRAVALVLVLLAVGSLARTLSLA